MNKADTKGRVLISVGLLLVVWLGLAYATYQLLVLPKGFLFDLYPRWYGARAMLGGNDPYSQEIARVVGVDMGYDTFVPFKTSFFYPATITYVLLPFWLAPFPVAVSLWMGLQIVLITLLPLVTFHVLKWRVPSLLMAVITFLSAFVFRHPVHVYIFAQFIIVPFACLILAWWAIAEDRPVIVAILLLGGTIRPEAILFTGAFLVDLLLTRKFRALGTWVGLMGGFFLLSIVQAGWWVPRFLESVSAYDDCCIFAYPPGFLTGGNPILSGLFTVGVFAWGAVMLWQMRPLPDRTRIPWSLSVVILAVLLTTAQSKDYTLIYALLPAWMIVWAGKGSWTSTLPIMVVLVSPWLYFATNTTLPDGFPLEQVVTPLVLAALLTWHWRMWRVDHATIYRPSPSTIIGQV